MSGTLYADPNHTPELRWPAAGGRTRVTKKQAGGSPRWQTGSRARRNRLRRRGAGRSPDRRPGASSEIQARAPHPHPPPFVLRGGAASPAPMEAPPFAGLPCQVAGGTWPRLRQWPVACPFDVRAWDDGPPSRAPSDPAPGSPRGPPGPGLRS